MDHDHHRSCAGPVKSQGLIRRWLAFNVVGLMGIVVQLGLLVALTGLIGLHYVVGTILAVEASVLHNFCWHEYWTWSDRTPLDRSGWFGRLIRFNLANGLISIVGNILIMKFLVGGAGMNYFLANLVAIAGCSVLNFMAGDRLVFRPGHRSNSTPA